MTEAPPRQQPRRAEYAAAITLIASSQAPQATKSAEIADILLRAALEAATIPAEAAAKVAKALAELVVVQRILDRRGRERGAQEPQGGSPGGASGVPGVRAPQQPTQPGEPVQRGREVRPQRVEEDELLRRSLYVVNGAMRMSRDVARGMDPMEALERESRHFLSHTEMQQKRRTAKRLRAVMREEHGNLLSWVHGDPKEPRILHEKADGHNVDVSAGAPAATGGVWPGELPGCTCSLAPPRPGAMVLE